MSGTAAGELRQAVAAAAQGGLLSWQAEWELAERFTVPLAAVEEAALETGVLPGRYQRNRETISTAQQLRLLRTTAAVVGCGGLGGYLVEELARLGVGRLILIDPDVFEEHNLNRQLLSTPALLHRPKVEAAAARVASVNPAVTPVPLQRELTAATAAALLAGADLVLDGLDSFGARRDLMHACRELRLPLVHGAIGGWYGQVATQLPGDDLTTFVSAPAQHKGVEARLGNPSFTPAVIASLQVAEACKVILGTGRCLQRRMLFVNLLDMEVHEVRL